MLARPGRAAAALVLVGLLVPACSNSESAVQKEPHTGSATASTVSGVQQVLVTTGDDYRFHPSRITAAPGPLRVILENKGKGAPHNLSVDNVANAFVPLTRAGTTSQSTFTLSTPGTYRFVCTIHTAQGQIGTLVVKPAP